MGSPPLRTRAGLPCDIPGLELTFGADLQANLAADAGTWAAYEMDQPYWVKGTNLLLLTHRPWSDGPAPGSSGSFHGSATSGAVAQACQGCYVFAVQDSLSLDGEPLRLLAEGFPWVDLVTSTNWPDGGADGSRPR
ncbi:MAG TPA: hypothetical protein VM327_10050 [Candidatus Thermoplasmatota archaeon]|nr:hypothetical protein [Candidatus Thermoplasmatota archaeon]